MDLSKYRHLYVTETQEILETLSRTLVDLEAAPGDRERVTTAFRLFHSIKGMSGTMGFSPIFDLAHQLEELMDQVRKGMLEVPGRTMDLLLARVDRLGQWVADVEVGGEPTADEEARRLHQRISLLVEGSAPPPPIEAPAGPLRRSEGRSGAGGRAAAAVDPGGHRATCCSSVCPRSGPSSTRRRRRSPCTGRLAGAHARGPQDDGRRRWCAASSNCWPSGGW
ncbi:MAG: Hpt domain-containing protein [bacterium]